MILHLELPITKFSETCSPHHSLLPYFSSTLLTSEHTCLSFATERYGAMFSCQIFVLVLATLFVTSTREINSSSYVVFVSHHTTTSFLCEEVEWLNDRIFYTFKALRGFATWFNKEEVQYIANIARVKGVFKDQATV